MLLIIICSDGSSGGACLENSPYWPGGIPVYQAIGMALAVEEMGKGKKRCEYQARESTTYGVDALRMIVSLIEIIERRLR